MASDSSLTIRRLIDCSSKKKNKRHKFRQRILVLTRDRQRMDLYGLLLVAPQSPHTLYHEFGLRVSMAIRHN